MNEKPLFFVGVPDWLKGADDDIFGVVMALLTEWEMNETHDVDGLYTELTTTFELSDEKAKEAIELLKTNKVIK